MSYKASSSSTPASFNLSQSKGLLYFPGKIRMCEDVQSPASGNCQARSLC